MNAGLVLLPDEIAYRSVQVWIRVHHDGCWAPSSWAQVLITDQRLLCRCPDAQIISLFWNDAAGILIALDRQAVTFNFGGHPPIALSGTGAAVLAVAAIAAMYGVPSLLTHPALAALRRDSPS